MRPAKKCLGLHPRGLVIVDLLVQLGLDGIEQIPIENGGLLARQDLTLEGHLSDVEPIAKQMGERTARERNAADGLSCLQRADLGDDAPFAQVGHQQVEAAELEIAAEDGPDPLGLGFIDGDLSILGVVAKRRHAADPEALAFGGGDLVPDALGGDLALELGKRQQHVQRQPAHRGGGVELLGDRDKGHVVLVEQFDEFGEVRQRAGQAVDLVDDDHVDLAGPHVLKEPLQGRPVGVAAREAAIVVFGPQQRPAGMRLTADIGLRGIVLGVERVEVLFEPLVGRDAGIDRAANRLRRSGAS